MKSWLAVVNPAAGRAKSRHWMGSVLRELRALGAETVFTRYRGHAHELARQASDYGGLALVGGDGTLHEVLAAPRPQEQAIAIVPGGRGNSLARDLGLRSLQTTLEAIRSRRTIRVDLMRVSYECRNQPRRECLAASTVAVGYPAAVVETANRRFEGLGRCCYVAAAFGEAFRLNSFLANVGYDGAGDTLRRLTGLVASNTRHLANFQAFPDASATDGRGNVMEMRAGLVRQTLHNLSVLSRRYFYSPSPIVSTGELHVRLDEPTPLMIDGELYPDAVAFSVRMTPGALCCHSAPSPA